MKNVKKCRQVLLAFILVFAIVISNSVVFADSHVRPKKVTKITCSQKTIAVGDEFELKAVYSPSYADDDYLTWSIVGKKGIIRFDDDDRHDDEMEFVALKAGTTKVRCSVVGKNKKYSKTFTVTVKKPTYKFSRVGKKDVKVVLGDEFELEVRKSSGLRDRHLRWSIKDTKIVGFEDSDRYGDDMEFIAKRVGKTTVTCKNLKTKKTISFNVEVVDDYDYYDDDYYDDDYFDDYDDYDDYYDDDYDD